MPEEEKPKLVTDDDKMGELEQKMLTTGPFLKVTSMDQLMELASAALATKTHFDKGIVDNMTEERAKRIREMRVDEGLSWRGVAATAHVEWGADAFWTPSSNQLAGMSLCEEAAKKFNEDYMKEPWN